MINVRSVIEEIVMSVRSSGSVDTFTDNAGSYIVGTSDIGNLQNGFKVVLVYADTSLNRDVVIYNVTESSFEFAGINITQPDSWEMALYFEIGHKVELNKKYLNKAKSTNKLVQEYPLVWLYTDFERGDSDFEDADFSTINFGAIVDFSKKELYEEQRIEDKFEPILYPFLELIDEAFNTLPYKANFVTPYGIDKEIKFITTDRPFFGSADQNKNVLPQVTDALEWSVSLNWRNIGEVCGKY